MDMKNKIFIIFIIFFIIINIFFYFLGNIKNKNIKTKQIIFFQVFF